MLRRRSAATASVMSKSLGRQEIEVGQSPGMQGWRENCAAAMTAWAGVAAKTPHYPVLDPERKKT